MISGLQDLRLINGNITGCRQWAKRRDKSIPHYQLKLSSQYIDPIALDIVVLKVTFFAR